MKFCLIFSLLFSYHCCSCLSSNNWNFVLSKKKIMLSYHSFQFANKKWLIVRHFLIRCSRFHIIKHTMFNEINKSLWTILIYTYTINIVMVAYYSSQSVYETDGSRNGFFVVIVFVVDWWQFSSSFPFCRFHPQ